MAVLTQVTVTLVKVLKEWKEGVRLTTANISTLGYMNVHPIGYMGFVPWSILRVSMDIP